MISLHSELFEAWCGFQWDMDCNFEAGIDNTLCWIIDDIASRDGDVQWGEFKPQLERVLHEEFETFS